jgi:hypothetical protein
MAGERHGMCESAFSDLPCHMPSNEHTLGEAKIHTSLIFISKLFLLKEMGGACSSYFGRERRVQGFGGETRGKETTGDTQV